MSEGLNKGTAQVREFHEAFSHPVSKEVTDIDLQRSIARSVWTGEEALVEFIHAASESEGQFLGAYNSLIEGLEKAKQKSLNTPYYNEGMETVVAKTDALVDALYFIFGSFVEMGIEPDIPFSIVQDANMSKLFTDEDGNKYAKYRESDGKIMKSPDFKEPEPFLEAEIRKQMLGTFLDKGKESPII